MSIEPYWLLAVVVVPAATVYASVTDCKQRRVPNRLTLALLLSGVAANLLFGRGMGFTLAGIAVGFGLLIVPYAMGIMGAGDVKLLAAIGAWLGAYSTLAALLWGAIVGGFVGGVMMIRRRWIARRAVQGTVPTSDADVQASPPQRLSLAAETVPYAVPLSIGAWVALALQIMGVEV